MLHITSTQKHIQLILNLRYLPFDNVFWFVMSTLFFFCIHCVWCRHWCSCRKFCNKMKQFYWRSSFNLSFFSFIQMQPVYTTDCIKWVRKRKFWLCLCSVLCLLILFPVLPGPKSFSREIALLRETSVRQQAIVKFIKITQITVMQHQ